MTSDAHPGRIDHAESNALVDGRFGTRHQLLDVGIVRLFVALAHNRNDGIIQARVAHRYKGSRPPVTDPVELVWRARHLTGRVLALKLSRVRPQKRRQWPLLFLVANR